MKINSWLEKKVALLKREIKNGCDTEQIIKLIDKLFPLTNEEARIHGYCVICNKPILEGTTLYYKDRDAHMECVKRHDREYYNSSKIPKEILIELMGHD